MLYFEIHGEAVVPSPIPPHHALLVEQPEVVEVVPHVIVRATYVRIDVIFPEVLYLLPDTSLFTFKCYHGLKLVLLVIYVVCKDIIFFQ